VKENWPGLVIALVVTIVAWLAIHPALRMLSDEAGLVGTSKNFWATRTATFTVSGKYYYDSYWDIGVAVDQRPALFPFLVSLVHVLGGYSYKNVFLFNLMVLPAFVLVSYRLAKTLGGETFAIVAALLVVAHPITLLSARSGGFDFFAAFFALLVIKSLLDHSREPSPERLAVLWMNLCMFAEIRYETGLFILPVVALLLLFRMVTWSALRPFAFIYALTPAFLMPRIWQAVFRGSVPEQDPGAIVFSFTELLQQRSRLLQAHPVTLRFPARSRGHRDHAWRRRVHSLATLALPPAARARLEGPPSEIRCPGHRLDVVQVILVFTYVWGRAQHPAAARLVLAIDTFFAFPAAWVLTLLLRRWRPLVAVLLAAAVVAFYLPVASQHRMLNKLTQTREAATTWRFFESLHEKRIIIVADRPGLYTIMEYGAMDFETARHDPVIFDALARGLFYDIYLVQQIDLTTNEPFPAYDIWPTHSLQTMLEFQNDANVMVRISRLAH
jgi:4-amino-4-deoxy-L-arabinose transferase-like glycosyltransferase